jgi:hypothetical protein
VLTRLRNLQLERDLVESRKLAELERTRLQESILEKERLSRLE